MIAARNRHSRGTCYGARAVGCAALLLALGVGSLRAGTLRYGVGGSTWGSFGIADNTDTGAGGLNLVVAQDDITFTLNVVSTADSGGELQLSGGGELIPATGGNVWEDADGTLVFTLSISDPSSKLQSIEVGNLDVGGWNAADEDMTFTDHVPVSFTKDPTTGGVSGGVISYGNLTGLTQLSTGNIASWSLEIDMDDIGKVSGLSYIEFNYTVTAGGPDPFIALSNSNVVEHAVIGTAIGSLSMINTSGDFTYSLPSGYGDNALFDLTGNDNSNLVSDAIFDWETDTSYDIRIVSTKDGGGEGPYTNDTTVSITGITDDPAVALSSQDVDEGELTGTVVGTLSTTNPIGTYTHAYSFGGGTDDASFTIDGTNLKTAEVFDDDVKNSYAIKLVSTIQEAGVSGDGPGAGPFTNDFTVTVNNTDPAGVIQIDFGRDNQSPKIGFVSGGSWNTINTAPHAEADAAVGDTYNLKATNGPPSGITIGGWTGAYGTTADNNQDGESFTGTPFQDSGYDVLSASTAGAAVGFTLSGFDANHTVFIRLAVAATYLVTNIADFTFDGSFGLNAAGDSFDVYDNAQSSSGTGTELVWLLRGATSYTFLMDPADDGNSRGGINGMIISAAPPRASFFKFQ